MVALTAQLIISHNHLWSIEHNVSLFYATSINSDYSLNGPQGVSKLTIHSVVKFSYRPMSHLIRKPHYFLTALTVIALCAWLVLKTDKSSSDSDIRDQGTGRHTVSQVSEHPSTSGGHNQSGTKDASTASVQATEMVKTKTTKTDDAHDRTQLVAATEKLPAIKTKGADAARLAKIDPRALRRFGKGAPFALGDLPDGKLKENLLALTPNHQAKALKWLHSFNFSGIDAIAHLRADNTGGIFYTCPGVDAHGNACAHHDRPSTPSTESAGLIEAGEAAESTSVPIVPVAAAAAVPVSLPPIYNSKPGSQYTMYLDFNGAVIEGKAWNTSYGVASWTAKAYSSDADLTTFSDAEQTFMRRVWERIAEDYAPFDINVTTDVAFDPDTYTGDKNKVAWNLFCPRVAAIGGNLPHAGYGGIAYVGVFGNSNYGSTYQPAFTKAETGESADIAAEAGSHEIGHNMGLSHDTRSNEGYYGGHTGAGAPTWGPIMGTGYNRNLSQWSKGEYYDSKHASWNGSSYDNNANTNDDLAIIAARTAYRTDDHGDTNGTATELSLGSGGGINQTGIISETSEVDVFSFSTGAGSITINADPFKADTRTWGGNLDITLELYDAGGSLVTSNNSATDVKATITTTITAGTYYIHIKPSAAGNASGTGSPYDSVTSTRAGYTIYGSVGQYTVTGTAVVPGVGIAETGTTDVTEGGATDDTYSIVLGTQPQPDTSVTVNISPDSQVTTNKSSVTFTTSNWNTPQEVTVTAVDDSLEEGTHTGTITHTSSSTDPAFDGIGVGSVIVNITDNDNIMVTSPNGGESFYANTVQAITWDSLLPGNVKIELLRGGSATTIVASTPNNGSYDWSIEQLQAPAADYSIRITSVETPARTDTGDGYFTIIEAPIYFTDLESADPGFAKTGDWEWGTPSGENAAASAYSGTQMYDTVLAGTSWATSVLTSVAIDCEDYTDVQLQYFLHALLRNDNGAYKGSFTLKVEVSNDGTSWGNTSGKSKIVFEQTGMNTSWVQYDYNIADIADGQPTVYIRWTQTNNNTGSYQTTGGGVAVDDIKLTGTYTSPVPTSSVVYNGNGSDGGSVPIDSAAYEDLATVTVLGNTGNLTKTGYAFSGWDIQAVGDGANYAPASTFTMGTSDVTLYAQWTALAPSYSVTYLGNGNMGGSVPVDASTYEEGVSVTVLGNTGNLTRDGFIFDGWSKGGVDYSPADTFDMGAADVTLSAKWAAVPTYTVIYDGGIGSTGSIPNQTKTDGVPLTLSNGSGFLKTGFTFVKWNTALDGTGTDYPAGGTYTANTGVTLYAQWTVSTYTISYTGNGQTAGLAPGNQTKIYDTNIIISDKATLVRSGHTFDSWNTDFGGGGTSYAVGATYSTNADLDLYAQWTPNTYTVSYNGNGNTDGSAPPNQTKTHGINLTLASDEGSLVRTGHTFSGWNTASNGSGTAYVVSETYIDDTAVTLYAQWSLTVSVLEEDFESPDTPTDFAPGVLPDNGKWVGADDGANGSKSDDHGITDKAGGDFVDSDINNDQAYRFDDTNTGITSALGKIGTLTSGTTYTITFDVIPRPLPGNNKLATDYKAQLIAFASGDARNDCRSTPAGSFVLEELTGNIASTVTFEYTTNDDAHGDYLDFDLGLRFIGSKTSAIIDNVEVTSSSLSPPPVPGPVDHFAISAINPTQTEGTPITGIIITAQDAANATATSFTGTVNFAGTAGITGTSASFVDGILTGVSVTPTVEGSDLTFTVDDGSSHTGSATFTVLSKFQSWAGGNTTFSGDTNNDGVADGLAWLLGSNDPSANAQGLTPAANSNGGGGLVMTFNYLNAANRGSAVMSVQYSQDMGVTDLWTDHTVVIPESSGTVNEVIFIITPNGNTNEVQATIPAGVPGASVFGRILGNSTSP